ncbi:hypothetical protein Tco_1063554 [Tanacetum coccineum]
MAIMYFGHWYVMKASMALMIVVEVFNRRLPVVADVDGNRTRLVFHLSFLHRIKPSADKNDVGARELECRGGDEIAKGNALYKFAPDLIMLEAYETVESWMIRKDLDPRKLIPTIISELEKMIQIVNSRAYQISEDRNFLEEKKLSFEVVTHLGHGIKIPVIDFSKLNGEEKAMTMAQISIHRTKLKWELFEIVKKVSSECYKTEREEDFFKNSTP